MYRGGLNSPVHQFLRQVVKCTTTNNLNFLKWIDSHVQFFFRNIPYPSRSVECYFRTTDKIFLEYVKRKCRAGKIKANTLLEQIIQFTCIYTYINKPSRRFQSPAVSPSCISVQKTGPGLFGFNLFIA